MTSMNFDVTASDNASREFLSIAAAADKLEERLRKLDGKKFEPSVDLNVDPANRKLDQLKTRLDALKNVRTQVDLTGADQARRDVTDLVVELRKLRDAKVNLNLASGTARQDIRQIADALKQLRDAAVKVTVNIVGEEKIDRLAAKLAKLSDVKVTVTVDVNDDRLAPLAAKLKALPNKTTTKVDVDVDKDGSSMSRLQKILAAVAALSPAIVASLGSSTAAVASFGGALATAVPVTVAGLGMLAGVLATVKIGTQGIGVAMSAFSEGDMKGFNTALKTLSPNAQAFTLELKDMFTALKSAQGGVQDQLFAGLGKSLHNLAAVEVPLLTRGMGGVASELNLAAKGVMGYLSSAEGVARQTSMWISTKQVVGNLRPAFTDVVAILSDLGEVGGRVLANVTGGIGGVTARWREWISTARDNGHLEQIMQAGVVVFQKLGSIIGNTGSILASFYRAADAAGSDFLTSLDRVTERWATMLKSAEGQSALTTFFRDSRAAMDNLMPGLEAVGRGILEMIRNFGETNGLAQFGAAVGEILTQVGAVIGPLGTLGGNVLKTLANSAALSAQVIGPLVKMLLDLVNATGPVGPAIIAAVLAFKQLEKVTGWVTSARDSLAGYGQAVNQVGQASQTLGVKLQAPIAAYKATSTAVQAFANDAGKAAATATTALGDRLAAGVQKGVDGVLKIPGAATQAGTALSTGLQTAANRASLELGAMAVAAKGAGTGLSTGLQTAVTRANLELQALPQTVSSAASTLKTGLSVAALDAGQKLRDVGTAAREAGSTITTGLGVAAIDTAQKVKQLPAAAAEAAATLRTAVGVAAIDAGQKLRDVGTAAVTAGTSLATGLRDGATQAGTALSTGLQTAVTRAKIELDALPQTAANAARALGDGLRTAGATAGNGLVDGLHTGLMGVGNALTGTASVARSGATSIASAIGDGLKAIPGHVESAFSTLGSVVNTGVSTLGRFSGAVAGAASSIRTGLSGAGSSLVSFLGGPWGVAFAGATVAVAGLSAAYEEFGSTADKNAQKVIQGSFSLTQAIAAEQAQVDKNQLFWFSAAQQQKYYADAAKDVTDEVKRQYDALSPFQKLQADVAIAQANLNDAIAQFGPNSSQAATASDALAVAQGRVKGANEGAERATRTYSEALRDQQQAAEQAFGALLSVESALARVDEAQKRADEAIAQHGRDSTEAKDALREYTQAVDSAAQAVGKQAESLASAQGADDKLAKAQGARAYSAALLTMAANAKGPAQEALKGYLGQLSQAELDALSAGAAASGFGTQVMTLPNGKTVKIAVDPETGKIITTQQLLDAMQKNPVMIKIGADTIPADQAFQRVLTAVQQGKATVMIDGQNLPALDALAKVGQQAGLTNATVTINGQTVSAMDALNGFIQSVKTGNPQVNIGGQDFDARQVFGALQSTIVGSKLNAALGLDPSGAQGTLAGFKTSASAQITAPLGVNPASANGTVATVRSSASQPLTAPLGANPAGANATIAGVRTAASAQATMPVGANVSSAQGSVNTAQTQARQPQTMPVGANTGAAQGSVNTVQANSRQQQTMPVAANTGSAQGSVNTAQSNARQQQTFAVNANVSPALQTWNWLKDQFKSITTTITTIYKTLTMAEGGVLPMASGGAVAAHTRTYASGGADVPGKTYAGHRLTPMSGNSAAEVAPRTWRVIGDRQKDTEVFIPLDGSKRSLAFTAYAANQQGYALTPIKDRSGGDTMEAYHSGGHRRHHRRRHHHRHWRWSAPADGPATPPDNGSGTPATGGSSTPGGSSTTPTGGPSTPPATTAAATGTYYTPSQVSTTSPFVQPAGSITQPPPGGTPGGGVSIDLSALIAEVQAVKAAVLATGPNNTDVVSAVGHLEHAIVGDRRHGHGYRAQCRRSDGELSRI